MASQADELAQARRRLDGLQSRLDRLQRVDLAGSELLVGTVYDGGSMPTAVPAVFLVRPLKIGGSEAEGDSPATSQDSEQGVPVAVVGPEIPGLGTILRARRITGRWVAGLLPCVTGDECPPYLIRTTVSGCGCALPDSTVGLYESGVLVDEVVTDSTGFVEWSSVDFPAIAPGGSWQIKVSDTPLYQDYETDVFAVAACITVRNITLTPVSGYLCGCCPGVPVPMTLALAGPLGSGTMSSGLAEGGSWSFGAEIPFDHPVNGFSAGGVDLFLGCGLARVQILCVCQFDFGDYIYEDVYIYDSGYLTVPFDCLGDIDLSLDFPGDFDAIRLTDRDYLDPVDGIDFAAECASCPQPGTITITEVSPPPKPTTLPGSVTEGTLCVTVRTLGCGGDPGDPVVGETVTVSQYGSPTPTFSGDTDGSGQLCGDITLGVTYVAEATVGGCLVTGAVATLTACEAGSSDYTLTLTVCCATACVIVKEYVEGGPNVAVGGATVTWIGGLESTADGSGNACIELQTPLMQTLPTVGGVCTARRLPSVRASKDGYLPRCVPVDVACGEDQTSTPTEIVLYPLFWPGTDPLLTRYEPWGGCEDAGCGTAGWIGRGLVPTGIKLSPVATALDDDMVPQSVLPDFSTPALFSLDVTRKDGGGSTTGSPRGDTGPILEYHAAGGAYTTAFGSYTGWEAWLAEDGLIFHGIRSGVIDVIEMPSSSPLSFCLPVEIDYTGSGTGDTFGERSIDWTIEGTETDEPPA